MSIRLRAHHLLCLLTYVGRGYSPAFVANMNEVAARLSEGAADVVLVEGPDDLCAPLLGTADRHCTEASARERDERAAADIAAHLGLPVRSGVTLSVADVAGLRAAFAQGTIRSGCAGCPWASMCDAVAASGYAETRFSASPQG